MNNRVGQPSYNIGAQNLHAYVLSRELLLLREMNLLKISSSESEIDEETNYQSLLFEFEMKLIYERENRNQPLCFAFDVFCIS